MDNNNKKFDIELSKEVAQGQYANFAVITHSSSDFVLDFARIMPGVQNATVCSRVIMAPEHAKRLLFALQENIAKYEKTFGPIVMPDQLANRTIAPFGTPSGEA